MGGGLIFKVCEFSLTGRGYWFVKTPEVFRRVGGRLYVLSSKRLGLSAFAKSLTFLKPASVLAIGHTVRLRDCAATPVVPLTK